MLKISKMKQKIYRFSYGISDFFTEKNISQPQFLHFCYKFFSFATTIYSVYAPKVKFSCYNLLYLCYEPTVLQLQFSAFLLQKLHFAAPKIAPKWAIALPIPAD